MHECSLCNGWGETECTCPRCGGCMKDQGRMTDFLDDYSPYLDVEFTDKVDGLLFSSQTGDCAHLFLCDECGCKDIRIS